MGKGILNHAITIVPTGHCEVDMPKAIKYFTDKCFISRWHDNYTLVRTTHKRCLSLKVQIKKQDALELIKKLNLVEINSVAFRNASTFRVPE